VIVSIVELHEVNRAFQIVSKDIAERNEEIARLQQTLEEKRTAINHKILNLSIQIGQILRDLNQNDIEEIFIQDVELERNPQAVRELADIRKTLYLLYTVESTMNLSPENLQLVQAITEDWPERN